MHHDNATPGHGITFRFQFECAVAFDYPVALFTVEIGSGPDNRVSAQFQVLPDTVSLAMKTRVYTGAEMAFRQYRRARNRMEETLEWCHRGSVFEQPPHWRIATPVYPCHTQLLQCIQMVFAGIALVSGQTITRIFAIQLDHFTIPGHFGDDRCSTDGSHLSVPDHRFDPIVKLRTAIAIDQHQVGFPLEAGYSALHSQQTGL